MSSTLKKKKKKVLLQQFPPPLWLRRVEKMTRQQSGRGTAAPRRRDPAQTKPKTPVSLPRGLFTRRERKKKLNEHIQHTHKAFRISVLKVGQQGPSGFCSHWSPVLRPHRWTCWAPVKGLIAPSERPPGVLCGRWRFDWKQVADGQTGHPETAGLRRHPQTGVH